MQPGSVKRGEMSQAFDMTQPHQNDVPRSRAEKTFTTLSATAIGLEMGVSVIIGVLLGMWLDSKAGTSPWLMVLFLILGFVAGMRSVIRAVRRADKAQKEGRLG